MTLRSEYSANQQLMQAQKNQSSWMVPATNRERFTNKRNNWLHWLVALTMWIAGH